MNGSVVVLCDALFREITCKLCAFRRNYSPYTSMTYFELRACAHYSDVFIVVTRILRNVRNRALFIRRYTPSAHYHLERNPPSLLRCCERRISFAPTRKDSQKVILSNCISYPEGPGCTCISVLHFARKCTAGHI